MQAHDISNITTHFDRRLFEFEWPLKIAKAYLMANDGTFENVILSVFKIFGNL